MSTNVEHELRQLGKLPLPSAAEGTAAAADAPIRVRDVVPRAVDLFGAQYGRDMRALDAGDEFVEARRMIEDGVEGRLPPLEKTLLGV